MVGVFEECGIMFERVGCVLKDEGLGRQTIIWTRKPTCFEPPLSVPFRSEILVVYFLLMKIIDRIKVFEVEYFYINCTILSVL